MTTIRSREGSIKDSGDRKKSLELRLKMESAGMYNGIGGYQQSGAGTLSLNRCGTRRAMSDSRVSWSKSSIKCIR